jgi:hypothetical protein
LYHKFLSFKLKTPHNFKFKDGKGGKFAVQRKKLKNKYKANLTNLRGKRNLFLNKSPKNKQVNGPHIPLALGIQNKSLLPSTKNKKIILSPTGTTGGINNKVSATGNAANAALVGAAKKMIENRINFIENLKNKKKTYFYFSITSAIEENKKKMAETINSMIFKHKKFDHEVSSIDTNNPPVYIINYSKIKKPVISHFLKSMSIFNKIIKGTFVYYSSSIGYFFNKKNNKQIKNTYKFLFYCFKTMFCLISKPVFIYKTDKIIIQLYYFVMFPYFLKN